MQLSSPQTANRDVQGSILVLTAAVLWGTTGTTQALIPGEPDPLGVGAIRIAIGGLALLALALYGKGFSRNRHWNIWSAVVTATGVAAFQLLFFAGVERAGVAIGTVIAIGSAPAFAGLIGWIVRGEQPSGRWALATAVAVTGAVLLIATSAGQSGDPIGIAFCLGAGASYAAYAVASKQLIMAGHPSSAVMAIAFAGGALLLSPLLLTQDIGWAMEVSGVMAALHLGVVTTAVAYLLFGIGLSQIPTSVATTLSLAEPLTASLLGVLLLNELLSSAQWAGAILILAGLVILTLPLRPYRWGERRPMEASEHTP